jgi:hypothetical protein
MMVSHVSCIARICQVRLCEVDAEMPIWLASNMDFQHLCSIGAINAVAFVTLEGSFLRIMKRRQHTIFSVKLLTVWWSLKIAIERIALKTLHRLTIMVSNVLAVLFACKLVALSTCSTID